MRLLFFFGGLMICLLGDAPWWGYLIVLFLSIFSSEQ